VTRDLPTLIELGPKIKGDRGQGFGEDASALFNKWNMLNLAVFSDDFF